VIVTSRGAYAEIQVRTDLQALWAEIYERLGDILGRGIRYGEPPDDGQLVVGPLITALQRVPTEDIAQSEAMQQGVTEILKGYVTLTDELLGHPSVSETLEKAKALEEGIESAKRGIHEMLREVLASLDDLVSQGT
jgi:hypothetical protein